MNDDFPQIESVLREFGRSDSADHLESLGSAGGFSGARFWRFSGPEQTLCLRRWPQGQPTPERLSFVHSVLSTVFAGGCSIVPVPLRAVDGRTFVEQAGHLWELTPWMPGHADFAANPSPARLKAAMQALAQFHVAANRHPSTLATAVPVRGLMERRDQLRRWNVMALDQLNAVIANNPQPVIDDLARQVIEQFHLAADPVRYELNEIVDIRLPQQPVIRDIWHDHVLFQGNQVSGLVDFGAMRVELVSCDISRLLGSLVVDDSTGWQRGLAAYESIRPLSADERRLVGTYDRTTVLLSGMNWLKWLYLEGRRFGDLVPVRARLAVIVARLQRQTERKHPLS